MVVDSRIALSGGMNLARPYMGPTPDPSYWLDLSVVVQGPAVADLESLFISDWAFATGEKLALPPHPQADRPDEATEHSRDTVRRWFRHGPGRGQRPGRAR